MNFPGSGLQNTPCPTGMIPKCSVTVPEGSVTTGFMNFPVSSRKDPWWYSIIHG
jgi:hypothetical protein